MRILFLGDYSNLHACLASQLRQMGHETMVVSDGGTHMMTHADLLMVRKSGGLTDSFRYLFKLMEALPRFRGFDVVQIINPHCFDLRPARVGYFLRRIIPHNRAFCLTLAGDDHFFIRQCLDATMFRFSEYRIGSDRTRFSRLFPRHEELWMHPETHRHAEWVYSAVDGAMAVLPEYFMAASPRLGDRAVFTNLPVQVSDIPFHPVSPRDKVKLFVGIRRQQSREIQKGTEDLARMALELQAEHPDRCEAIVVENLPLREYLERLDEAHIVLDQLYAYSPATNALQAMAAGKVAASGATPEYYKFINEPDRGAIIPLSPLNDNKEILRRYILDPSPLPGMAAEGRRIVERHNDVRHIAGLFVDRWQQILDSKSETHTSK